MSAWWLQKCPFVGSTKMPAKGVLAVSAAVWLERVGLAIARLDHSAVPSLKKSSAHKQVKVAGDWTAPRYKLEWKSVCLYSINIVIFAIFYSKCSDSEIPSLCQQALPGFWNDFVAQMLFPALGDGKQFDAYTTWKKLGSCGCLGNGWSRAWRELVSKSGWMSPCSYLGMGSHNYFSAWGFQYKLQL